MGNGCGKGWTDTYIALLTILAVITVVLNLTQRLDAIPAILHDNIPPVNNAVQWYYAVPK